MPNGSRTNEELLTQIAALQSRAAELEGLLQETRQAYDTAEAQRQLLQLVLDTMPMSIFWKDRDIRFLGCNRQFARESGGSSSADLIGKTDNDMVWASHAELYRADDRQVMETDTPKLNYEEPQALGGWLRTTKIPLHDDTGAVIGVLGFFEDITERKRADEEQRLQNERIIQSQQITLQELSTPLIPLADGVIALPIVGAIDTARAQQIIESLLTGINEVHAEVAILDITGVRVVDTQVANALLRAAQAAKLLGTQVILTGISPEVAQALVQLGADLSGIVTRSNLQSGIAFALGKAGGLR